jgi:hypothetical protein
VVNLATMFDMRSESDAVGCLGRLNLGEPNRDVEIRNHPHIVGEGNGADYLHSFLGQAICYSESDLLGWKTNSTNQSTCDLLFTLQRKLDVFFLRGSNAG